MIFFWCLLPVRDANSAASYMPRGKPIKKASYERSKDAWRTCDLPMPQGTTRTQPASPSFLCLSFYPFSSYLLPSIRERFLASRFFGSRPTAPFAGSGSKPHDLWVHRTLYPNGRNFASFQSVASYAIITETMSFDARLAKNCRRTNNTCALRDSKWEESRSLKTATLSLFHSLSGR